MRNGKLSDEAKTHAVRSLACFDTPSAVAQSIRQDFGIEITPQSVERYDPTRVAGKRLSARWRQLFEITRDAFVKETATIAISHRSVRLRALQRMQERAEEAKNYPLAAQLLEQAAKEVGNFYTNRREVTGKNGTPAVQGIVTILKLPDNGRRLTAKEAADAYAATIKGGP